MILNQYELHLCLVTILSGFEINNFAGQPASGSARTLLPCLTCFGSGSEPCFAGFGHAAVVLQVSTAANLKRIEQVKAAKQH
jgi:hypothetical protein